MTPPLPYCGLARRESLPSRQAGGYEYNLDLWFLHRFRSWCRCANLTASRRWEFQAKIEHGHTGWRICSIASKIETDIFAKVILAKRVVCYLVLNDAFLSFFRLFGTKCAKCSRSVTKNDFVMRAKNQIYHIECFRCLACSRQLVPGDEYVLREPDGLFCKEDNEIVERAAQTAHARASQRSSSQSSSKSVCFRRSFCFYAVGHHCKRIRV